jgi:hypothetical protein
MLRSLDAQEEPKTGFLLRMVFRSAPIFEKQNQAKQRCDSPDVSRIKSAV